MDSHYLKSSRRARRARANAPTVPIAQIRAVQKAITRRKKRAATEADEMKCPLLDFESENKNVANERPPSKCMKYHVIVYNTCYI